MRLADPNALLPIQPGDGSKTLAKVDSIASETGGMLDRAMSLLPSGVARDARRKHLEAYIETGSPQTAAGFFGRHFDREQTTLLLAELGVLYAERGEFDAAAVVLEDLHDLGGDTDCEALSSAPRSNTRFDEVVQALCDEPE